VSDERWLSDHLLGEDDAEGRRAAERRLAADPGLRERAARLAAIARELDALPADGWPPESIEAAPEATGPPTPATGVPRRRRMPGRRPRLGWALAGLAVVVLAAGVGLGAVLWAGGGSPRGRRVVVLSAVGSTPPRAHGSVRLSEDGTLTIAVDGLPADRARHFYEAWLMTSRTRLVALASFRVDSRGRATVRLPLGLPLRTYRYVDVSLQAPGDGSAHSTDSVLRGSTS
jgi:anti-sigma-K factor RskA